MRHALFVPVFDALSDPTVLAGVAAEAEDAGWDGFFCWDHVAYSAPVRSIADPWIGLAAVACATERLVIGPMVTPLARRRPIQVAREVASLDQLSQGRVIFGIGLGDDAAGEFSRTGDQTDPRVRGAMLDESLEVLREAWSGQEVHHRGPHYVLDGLTVLPTPVQRPHPPVWAAVRRGNRAPLRRAARCDGVFPIGVSEIEQLAAIVDACRSLRPEGAAARFDVAVEPPAGADPAALEAAGATWLMTRLAPYHLRIDEVMQVVRTGPPT